MRGLGSKAISIPPEDDLIERYAIRICPEDQAAALERHLVGCSECRLRLTAAKEWITLMKLALTPDGGGSTTEAMPDDGPNWFYGVASSVQRDS